MVSLGSIIHVHIGKGEGGKKGDGNRWRCIGDSIFLLLEEHKKVSTC